MTDPRPDAGPDREALARAIWRAWAGDDAGGGPGGVMYRAADAVLALLPSPPAPGGGDTDLRAEVERLCNEAKAHWSASGPGVPMVTVEALRAALAARPDAGSET